MRKLGIALLLPSLLGLAFGQHLACENRNPDGHVSLKQNGDGTFEIEVIGREAEKGSYIPNEVYTGITNLKGCYTQLTNSFSDLSCAFNGWIFH